MNRIQLRWIFVIILLLFALLQFDAFGQVVTDSVTWEVYDVEQEGDPNCRHDWVKSGQYDPKPGIMCGVIHRSGEECSWHWPHEDQICKKCGRMEHLSSTIHQSYHAPPKTEYQKQLEKWEVAPDQDITVYPSQPYYYDGDILVLPYTDSLYNYKVSLDTSFWTGEWILDGANKQDTTGVRK